MYTVFVNILLQVFQEKVHPGGRCYLHMDKFNPQHRLCLSNWNVHRHSRASQYKMQYLDKDFIKVLGKMTNEQVGKNFNVGWFWGFFVSKNPGRKFAKPMKCLIHLAPKFYGFCSSPLMVNICTENRLALPKKNIVRHHFQWNPSSWALLLSLFILLLLLFVFIAEMWTQSYVLWISSTFIREWAAKKS